MDLQRNKYANYRYSNYMQEGLAVLKIGSSIKSVKFTNDRTIGKNNNILYSSKLEFTPNLKASLPNKLDSPVMKERLNLRQDKKPYEDKAIRTVKNFIGKSCYNVRQPSNF